MSKSYYKKSKDLKKSWENCQDRKKISDSLRRDEISIVSTDTILGFLANTTKSSFNSIQNLKSERSSKPFIILINSIDKLKNFIDIASITNEIKYLLNKCWPGPLTVIFKAKKDLPSFFKSESNTIAIRIPKHKELLLLLKEFDGLFSTSANISGNPAPKAYDEIDTQLLQNTKFFVDNTETKTSNKPSTIIDCSQDNIRIIRLGAYSKEELENHYGKKI